MIKKRFYTLTEAEIITEPSADVPKRLQSYYRSRCRNYCDLHKMPVPSWAQYRYDPNADPIAYLQKPKIVTRYRFQKAREVALGLGLEIPDWAKLQSEMGEKAIIKARNKAFLNRRTKAVSVLVEVTLAMRSGIGAFWERALQIAEGTGDTALVTAVAERGETAYAEARRAVLDIDPLFGRHHDGKPKAVGGGGSNAGHKQTAWVTAKSKPEQAQAWQRFCAEHFIAPTTERQRRVNPRETTTDNKKGGTK